MKVSTVYPITREGKEWVVTIEGVSYSRDNLIAKIKLLVKRGLPVEEEWAALAIIDRRQTEDRWREKDTVGHFHRNLPNYEN